MKILGRKISAGIAVGKPIICQFDEKIINKTEKSNIEREIRKLRKAIAESIKQLDELYNITLKKLGENNSEVFMAHKILLEDQEIEDRIIEILNIESCNVEWAIQKAQKEFSELFENMTQDYFKERANDIKDVCQRVLQNVDGHKRMSEICDTEEGIIIAYELTPSQTALFDREKIKGIITEKGGINGHAAIIARTLQIPYISGIKNIFNVINDDDEIILDGNNEFIFVNPTHQMIEHYEAIIDAQIKERESLRQYIGLENMTRDGQRLKVYANIANIEDTKMAVDNDCGGIGLFRTEFIYMNRNYFPSEDEHFAIYKVVAEMMKGMPVTIRTLDVGGDKQIEYFGIEAEENPYLGYRAIRYCLEHPEEFLKQLKGILRASVYGNLKIMFPMIISKEELKQALIILENAKSILRKSGIKFDEAIKVGIMIETPAAAIIADELAKEVDFFSIGTNDLTQYMLAVDRNNKKVENLYSIWHTGMLRIIKMIIDHGHDQGIEVGICGEAASDIKFISKLIEMGIDEISINPSQILLIRKAIREMTVVESDSNLL